MAEVPLEIAHECMQHFNTIMNGNNLEIIKESFSSSVTFQTPAFASWLAENNYLENTTEIKLSFGIYTTNAAERLNVPHLAGRLTAFVWPINANTENPPFNVGTLAP